MDTIIEKIWEYFNKQTHKIPQALIIIYVYTLFFPSIAIKVKDILMDKIQILLPTALKESLIQLRFSLTELLTLWSFLLIIYLFVVIADIVKKILEGQTLIFINSSGETLFEINSIIFVSLLIYCKLNDSRILNSFPQFSDFYSSMLVVSGIIFISIFCLTYCSGILLICQKIKSAIKSKN